MISQLLALSAVILSSSTVGPVNAQDTKGKTPPTRQIQGPRRLVSVGQFEVRIAAATQGPTVSIGAGLNNTSASGSGSDGTIEISDAEDFGTGLSEMMVTALIDSNAFSVLETGEETEEGDSSPFSSEDSLPTGAQFYIKGTITELSCRQRSGSLSLGGLFGGKGEYENKVVLDVRMVNALTGQIEESVKAIGRKKAKGSIFGLEHPFGSSWDPDTKILDLRFEDFESSPLGEATRAALEDAVKRLLKKAFLKPWEASVVKVLPAEDGLEFYLNVDSTCGLKVGDQLDLLRQGEQILDEKTKRILGRTRAIPLGLVVVTAFEGGVTICKAAEGIDESPLADTADLIVRFHAK